MKRIIFVFIIIFLALCKITYAQHGDTLTNKKFNRLSVAVSGGMGIPVGKFVPYNSTNYAGPPNVGFLGKIETMYLLFKNLGLECTYYGSANNAGILNQNTLFPNYWNGAMGGGYGQTLTNYSTKTWYTNSVLLGIAAHLKSEGFSVNFKILGGLQQAKSPETVIEGKESYWQISPPISNSTNLTTIQPIITSYNFVFGAGFDARFRIWKKIGYIIATDFLISSANFKGNLIDQNGNKSAFSFNQVISIYSLNMGIYYDIK